MIKIKWLDKLARKYRKFAIPNLMQHIVIITGIVYIFTYLAEFYTLPDWLALHPHFVMQGEIWRLITYIFIPPTRSQLFIIFVLYFYYMIGMGLESKWGSAKFNLYYLIGMLATTVASFITRTPATATYLNLSLFLAFAKIYPNYQIRLFLILPIKVKYLAIFNWLIIGYTVVFTSGAGRISALTAVVNFFLFFGPQIISDLKRKKRVYNNRQRFKSGFKRNNKAIHKCTVCGITENDDSKMQFRYCSDCEGAYEYCMDHLDDHQHKQ